MSRPSTAASRSRTFTGRPPALLLGALAAALAAAPAAAHDLFLLPERSQAGPGVEFGVALHVSDVFPGAPTAWRGDRTSAFFLQDARGRLDLLDRAPAGDPPRPRVALRTGGTAVIALVTSPSRIELDPADFADYLRHEGHGALLPAAPAGAPAGKARERYIRYVKTLVRGGAGEDPSLTPLGLPIEIVPEASPAGAKPGGTLPVRVILQGRPYAGGYLCATHAGFSKEHDAYAWCGRLDGAGRAEVPIRAPGWQLLRLTHMRPVEGDPDVGWESLWAALTFEVAPPASPRGR